MIPQESRGLGYYAASHWLQSAVVLIVLGVLAIGLLSALNDAKERAEKLMVELTIRNMRTGMQFAMGEALIRQRESEIASWAGSNPVRWLGTLPAGYRGECSVEESRNLSDGEWCFEQKGRELVYRPRNIDNLNAQPENGGRQCGQLSWRVAAAKESVASGGFVGLRIEAASLCQWVLKGR